MIKWTNAAIRWLFAAAAGTVLLIVTCFSFLSYHCKRQALLPNYALLLCIIAATVLWLFCRGRMRLSGRQLARSAPDLDRFVKIAAIVLLAAQIYVAYNIYFFTGWDAKGVFATAQAIVAGEPDVVHYAFSSYPNNRGTLLVEVVLLRLGIRFGMFTPEQAPMHIIVFNCLLNTAACVLVYRSAALLVSKKSAFAAFLLAVAAIGTSPWSVIYYSDAIGLIFPIAGFYLFAVPVKKRHVQIACRAASVVLLCCSYFIKPQCAIMLIAVMLVQAAYTLGKPSRRSFLRLGAAAACAAVTLIAAGAAVEQASERLGVRTEEERRIGMVHFLLMGLNTKTDGVYAHEDVEFAFRFDTKEERDSAELAAAADRLKAMGPIGLGRHLIKKTLVLFADGTFAWGAEGEFYSRVPAEPNTEAAAFLRSVFYNNEMGTRYPYLALLQHTAWLAILLFSLAAVCGKGEKRKSVSMLAVIGLTLFELLFEARARYLYTYVPVYCVLAALGMQEIRRLYGRIAARRAQKPPVCG